MILFYNILDSKYGYTGFFVPAVVDIIISSLLIANEKSLAFIPIQEIHARQNFLTQLSFFEVLLVA